MKSVCGNNKNVSEIELENDLLRDEKTSKIKGFKPFLKKIRHIILSIIHQCFIIFCFYSCRQSH